MINSFDERRRRARGHAHTRALKRKKTLHRSPRVHDTARDFARDSHSFIHAMSLGCRECARITTTRALVALALALALSLTRPAFASPSPDRRDITGIVVVDERTGTFMDSITRRRVRARGANAYWLRFASMGNERERENVHKTLDAMHDLGLDVVRTWAFMDGNEKSFDGRFTQGTRGDFRESSHAALDRLLTTCREKNLRVILTLTNYWPDYGGIDRYVEWAREEGDENARRREDFYTSTKCRDAFARYAEFLAGRRNTITGELYRDDPTIFSYQLINEPRVRGDTSDGAVFEEWVRAFAETIRRVDGGRHLVSVGTEGFFAASSPRAAGGWPGRAGVACVACVAYLACFACFCGWRPHENSMIFKVPDWSKVSPGQ